MVATGIFRRREKRALDPTCAVPRALPRMPMRGEKVATLVAACGLVEMVIRGTAGFFGVGAGFGMGLGLGRGVGIGGNLPAPTAGLALATVGEALVA